MGAVDTFAAALIFFPFSEHLVFYLMMYMIAKGGFFTLTNIASRNFSPSVLLSVIDVMTGLALAAISFGIASNAINLIGFIAFAKGLFCIVTPILS